MNRKLSLLISVCCFTGVLAIFVYSFFDIRDMDTIGDVGLGLKKTERNIISNDKDNSRGITLIWDNMSNAKSYNLYWSHNPGVTKKNGNKIANVNPPFRFNHAKKGLTYYFVVTAINESGESGESKEISFKAGK